MNLRLIAFATILSASAEGAVIVSSYFGAGDEGWRVGDFLVTTPLAENPVYSASEGNPEGFLRTADLADWSAYLAPAKFLGNKAIAYGGVLGFDLRIQENDSVTYSAVEISDGVTRLQFRGMPQLTQWITFTIPLMASSGWELSTNGKLQGQAASEQQLFDVLSNLQYLKINSDWKTGLDQADLDNVYLMSPEAQVPEPASFLLVGSALLAAGLLGRGRRRV